MRILAIDPGTLESGKKFKIYIHTCPNGKRYIGMTSLSTYNRWRKGKGYKNCKLFNRAIKKYGWGNIKHEVVYSDLSLEKAQKTEIKLIKEFKSNISKYGYNTEIGGQKGALGIKRSKETLIKMSLANKGKKMPKETKKKISNSLKGRVFTEEHSRRKSLSQTGEKNHRYGKKASNDTRLKMIESQKKGKHNKLSVKVIQYSKETNEEIKTWDSMGDIRRALGFSHCGISDNCRGKQNSAHGFVWKYKNNINATI